MDKDSIGGALLPAARYRAGVAGGLARYARDDAQTSIVTAEIFEIRANSPEGFR